jgi:hypothetical protein
MCVTFVIYQESVLFVAKNCQTGSDVRVARIYILQLFHS